MSIHDELFADGVDVLADVCGRAEAGTYFAPDLEKGGEPVVFSAIVGVVDVDHDLTASGEFDRRRRMERVTIRPLSAEIDWKLNGEVLLAGDTVKWQVKKVIALGSLAPNIHLKRQFLMEQGRSGRTK